MEWQCPFWVVEGVSMQAGRVPTKTIDEYIRGFPVKTQTLLKKIRTTIRKAAPKAEEAMKYGIPTFVLHGNLVHFGGYERHIGFYPTPSAIQKFRAELAAFEGTKGAVRFPLDKPLPLALIRRMVLFRVAENLERSGIRRKQ